MTSSSPERPRRLAGGAPAWWTAALVLLAVATGIYLFAPTEADPDLWGHVRFGLDTLDTGRLVRPDPYAYTSGDVPWINHEWLSEAIMGMAFRAAGPPGLIATKLAIGMTLAALLVAHLRRRRLDLLPALLITAYAVAVMLPGFRSLRPQAFTYLAFLAVLLLIHRASRGHPRALWWATPVFACWVNLHGGFVAGLGVLIASSLLARDRWLPAAAAVLATLLNPYGIGLWTFLAHTLGPRPDIAEWQAVSLMTIEGVAYVAVLAFGAIGLPALVRSRQWLPAILFAGGAALPFLARRHLPLFVLITMVFCAEHSAAAVAAFVRRRSRRVHETSSSASGDRFRPIVAAVVIAQAVLLLVVAAPSLMWIRMRPADYPIAATDRLVRSGVAAHLAVDFDWGEYVIWHAGPRIQVSVDGRRETVYSEATYELNQRFTAGVDGWDALLSERPTDLALVSVRTGAFDRLSRRSDWILLHRDDVSALFGRSTAAATRALQATPPSIPSLLPSSRAIAFP